MRSRAAAGFIAMAGIFLTVGLAFQSWELVSLVLPLSVLLTVLLFFPGAPKIQIEGRWNIDSERVLAGDILEINLELLNRGESADLAIVEVRISEEAEILEGSPTLVLSLRSGEGEHISYRLRFPRRGAYSLGPVKIRVLDMLGLAEYAQDLDLCATVRVAPKVYEIKPKDLVPSRVRLATGNVDSRILGAGMEFFSLRTYAPGDDFRAINWKASARLNDIVVNQYMSQRSCDVAVVLDAVGMNTESLDGAAEMAASLSTYFLRQRDRVGVAAFGQFAKVIRPDYGKRQMYRILDSLIEIRTDPERSQFKLARFLDRYFLRDALVILITSIERPEAAKAIEEITRSGRHVVVISPRPQPLPDDLEGRLRALEREDAAYSIRRYARLEEWDISRHPVWMSARGRAQ